MDFNALLAPASLHAIGLSVKIALISVPLFLGVGLLLAWALTKRGACTAALDIVVTLPLIFPPIVLGFALLYVVGRHSLVGDALSPFGVHLVFSFWGVLLAAFIAGLPLAVKTMQAALEALPANLREASLTLRYGEWATFWGVLVPNIRGAVLTGVLLAFGRSIGEVGITLMLGGNVLGETETVSLAIYNHVMAGEQAEAAVLSIGLGVVATLIFLVLRLTSRPLEARK
ncbi:MAG: molybdate ABC transporter permease subunit [Halothiobacillaceae bacterium]